MKQYTSDDTYEDEDALPSGFKYLGQRIEIIMTVYVPEEF